MGDKYKKSELESKSNNACKEIMKGIMKNLSLFDRVRTATIYHIGPDSGHARNFRTAVKIGYDTNGFDNKDKSDLFKFGNAVKNSANPTLKSMGYSDIDISCDYEKGHLVLCFAYAGNFTYSEAAELIGEGFELNLFKRKQSQPYQMVKKEYTEEDPKQEVERPTRAELLKRFYAACDVIIASVNKNKSMFDRINHVSKDHLAPKSGNSKYFNAAVCVKYDIQGFDSDDRSDLSKFISAVKSECNPKINKMGFEDIDVNGSHGRGELSFGLTLEDECYYTESACLIMEDEANTSKHDKSNNVSQYANFTKDQVKDMFDKAVNILQLSIKKASSSVKSAGYKSSSKHLEVPGYTGMDYDVKAYITVKHGNWTENDTELSQFFNEIKDNFNRTIQGFRLKLEGDSDSETTIVVDYYRRFKYGATIKESSDNMDNKYYLLPETSDNNVNEAFAFSYTRPTTDAERRTTQDVRNKTLEKGKKGPSFMKRVGDAMTPFRKHAYSKKEIQHEYEYVMEKVAGIIRGFNELDCKVTDRELDIPGESGKSIIIDCSVTFSHPNINEEDNGELLNSLLRACMRAANRLGFAVSPTSNSATSATFNLSFLNATSFGPRMFRECTELNDGEYIDDYLEEISETLFVYDATPKTFAERRTARDTRLRTNKERKGHGFMRRLGDALASSRKHAYTKKELEAEYKEVMGVVEKVISASEICSVAKRKLDIPGDRGDSYDIECTITVKHPNADGEVMKELAKVVKLVRSKADEFGFAIRALRDNAVSTTIEIVYPEATTYGPRMFREDTNWMDEESLYDSLDNDLDIE